MSFSGQTMPSWYDIIGFSIEHAEDEGGIKDSVKTGTKNKRNKIRKKQTRQ